MSKHIVVIIALALLLSACRQVVPQRVDPEETIHQIEHRMPVLSARGLILGEKTTLEQRMAHYHVPGVSIAVIDNHEIEWARGYGVAHAGESNPVTPDTLFQAASISKPATAMAVLHLVERGALALDRDVNERLVSWQVPASDLTVREPVTLRRLLSHTAGFNKAGKFGYFQDKELPTLRQVLDGAGPAHSPPWQVEAVPGTRYQYSNGGYVTIAQLLIDETSRPFPQVLRETVFDPLGMSASTFDNPLPDERQLSAASAHGKWGQPIYGRWLVYPEMGAAGLWSTPTDLARLAQEVMLARKGQSRGVLSQEMATEMLTPQADDVPDMSPLNLAYGLGWYLWGAGGQSVFVHGGDNPEGFQSIVLGLPERGWGVAIMTNGANGNRLYMEILYAVAQAYGLVPSLRALALAGYLLFLLLAVAIVWAVAYPVLRLWPRKPGRSGAAQEKGLVRRYVVRRHGLVFLLLIPVAVLLSVFPTYIALEIVAATVTDPTLETHQPLEALGMIERGNLFAQHGMMQEAIAAYGEAEALAPDLELSARDWNKLCWYGSLWGQAGEAMEACDRAVALEPGNAAIKDSRGLARALTGDQAGAIEDFGAYVAWLERQGGHETELEQRQFWVAELQSGRNPLDKATLEELR
jgi:CubicO group peptidase (beta-lactamase class C family)